jgi:hypothetical protein
MQRPSQQGLLQATPGVLALFPLSHRVRLQTGVGAAFPVIFPRYSYLDEAGQRRTYHVVQMGLWAELGAALRVGP